MKARAQPGKSCVVGGRQQSWLKLVWGMRTNRTHPSGGGPPLQRACPLISEEEEEERTDE